MTLQEIVEKRRRSWEKRHDIQYDNELVTAAIQYIHKSKELKQEIKQKPWLLIEIAFTIVDKEQQTVPFFLNEVQQDIQRQLEDESNNKPFYVLKGRQQGVTSFITAVQLCCSIVRKNFAGFTIADTDGNTNNIFNDKGKAVYRRLPDILKPHEQYNNQKEFYFDKLNSSWRISTASKDIGRSKTLNFCHFSEIATFSCPLSELQKGIGEAIVKNAIVFYETTAHGYNEAKDLWDSGTCNNLFYEWWRSAEYADDDIGVLDKPNEGGKLESKAVSWILDRIQWLKAKGISERQIAWYVKKFKSYLEPIASIRQEYPCSADEAFVASGASYFGDEMVLSRLDKARDAKPSRVGYFTYNKEPNGIDRIKITDIKWVDDPRGSITIHTEPVTSDKEKGSKPYVIGGDTAGEGSDYYTAKVLDNITGNSVATLWKQHTDDDLYAEQLYCLGSLYNWAMIGLEVNFSYAPTERLVRCGYPNLYLRERVDSLTNKVEKKFGFRTTTQTRQNAISVLKTKFRESEGGIECDAETLREMLTFVPDDKGKAVALAGKHDDLVMALAIAHQVSEQGSHRWTEPPKEVSIIDNVLEMAFGINRNKKGGNMGAKDFISWD